MAKAVEFILIDSDTTDGLSHLVSGVICEPEWDLHGHPYSVTWDDGSISFVQAVARYETN